MIDWFLSLPQNEKYLLVLGIAVFGMIFNFCIDHVWNHFSSSSQPVPRKANDPTE